MTNWLLGALIGWTERGYIPDTLIRVGVRALCRQRLREEKRKGADPRWAQAAVRRRLERAPIAPVPEKANEQHYEVPAALFLNALGRRLKYSCCYWPEGTSDLDRAEEAALELTCRRAKIEDGMTILELGCGWGSLALWLAEQYPSSRITALSNSHTQREFIVERSRSRGLPNLEVVTADMNDFDTERRYDRVVSVEMFEHMRNYGGLFERIARWLRPGGKLFVHVFCHRDYAYEFETQGAGNWMGRHFFTGGMMLSERLLVDLAAGSFRLSRQWRWSGVHYERTANAWLRNLDRHRSALVPVFERAYGPAHAGTGFMRWRLFFIACAELFGYRGGTEWFVAHYLFARR